MESFINKKWEENKEYLEEYIRTHEQSMYSSYKDLISAIIINVLNRDLMNGEKEFSTDFVEIDDGDYQGTLIYILHVDTYQPSVRDYYSTNVSYGSCSGCDTLLRISQYDNSYPTESQIKEYMVLCLHIIQEIKCLA